MSDDIIEQLRQQERDTSKRIDELAAEQAELVDNHRRIRRAIAALEGKTDPIVTNRRNRSQITRKIALEVINSSGRSWRVPELVREMRASGWDVEVKDEESTVREMLSRALLDGDIARPGYGVYGPVADGSAVDTQPAGQVVA